MATSMTWVFEDQAPLTAADVSKHFEAMVDGFAGEDSSCNAHIRLSDEVIQLREEEFARYAPLTTPDSLRAELDALFKRAAPAGPATPNVERVLGSALYQLNVRLCQLGSHKARQGDLHGAIKVIETANKIDTFAWKSMGHPDCKDVEALSLLVMLYFGVDDLDAGVETAGRMVSAELARSGADLSTANCAVCSRVTMAMVLMRRLSHDKEDAISSFIDILQNEVPESVMLACGIPPWI